MPPPVEWLAYHTFLDGYHRVPNVNVNSNGDFNWNLDNFEDGWNDNDRFLRFRGLFDFSRYLLVVGVFSFNIFFQR